MSFEVIVGRCEDVLKTVPDACVDSVVTDPPAGIDFMSKDWDCFRRKHNPNDVGRDDVFGRTSRTSPHSYGESERDNFILFITTVFKECFRVLKPGGYALVWALPRTSHWTAMGIEDAGFEIRDVIVHLFSTGFPKSMDVAKAAQKADGVEPLGTRPATLGMANNEQWNKVENQLVMPPLEGEAAKLAGLGTALKPAAEHWILARKKLIGTVVENVRAHGTGALNIDGCRVACAGGSPSAQRRETTYAGHNGESAADSVSVGRLHDRTSPERYAEKRAGEALGRFPANFVISHALECVLIETRGVRSNGSETVEEWACVPRCAVRQLDAQGGESRSRRGKPRGSKTPGEGWGMTETGSEYDDEGGPSRFFYTAKPARSEKDAGLADAGIPPKYGKNDVEKKKPFYNDHPTVKGTALMRYLCRLVTPAGGLVLDPFAGSGTTGVAAILEGLSFAGVEQDAGHADIARARMSHAEKETMQDTEESK